MNFQEKYGPWALVAGASEGLGAAFAEELARRGLSLVLLARRQELLEQLALKLHKTYAVEVRIEVVDLSATDQIQDFLHRLDVEVGLLVYNAAFAPIGEFKELSPETLLKVADVNIRAPLLLSRRLSEKMLLKKQGGLIFMSSLAGTQGSPKIAAYAASKAFNTILAEGLWSELKGQGVDVLASCAGAIRTPGYHQARAKKEAPGTLDASVVAAATLQALGRGPVVVPGRLNRFARFLMGRLLPRKWAITMMKNNTKDLS